MVAYELLWDIYFAQVVAMMMHPGNVAQRGMPDLDIAADLVELMLKKRSERCQPYGAESRQPQ